jgi:NADH-quinone oxidoreductase subunit J
VRSAPDLADDIDEVQRQLGVDPAASPSGGGKSAATGDTTEEVPK